MVFNNFIDFGKGSKEIKFSYNTMRMAESMLECSATKFHEVLSDVDTEKLVKLLALATSSEPVDVIYAIDTEKICLIDAMNAVTSAFIRYLQGEPVARQMLENLNVQKQSAQKKK